MIDTISKEVALTVENDVLRGEIERLRAELQTCRNKLKASGRAKLRSEVEALREDAERYRWLRSAPSWSTRWSRWEIARYFENGCELLWGVDLDAAIDASVEVEKKHDK